MELFPKGIQSLEPIGFTYREHLVFEVSFGEGNENRILPSHIQFAYVPARSWTNAINHMHFFFIEGLDLGLHRYEKVALLNVGFLYQTDIIFYGTGGKEHRGLAEFFL